MSRGNALRELHDQHAPMHIVVNIRYLISSNGILEKPLHVCKMNPVQQIWLDLMGVPLF